MVRIWNAMRRMGLPPRGEWFAGVKDWARTEGCWYAGSAVFHFLAVLSLMLVPMPVSVAERDTCPSLVSPPPDSSPLPPLERTHLGDAPLEPSELDTASLLDLGPIAQTEEYYDDGPVFEHRGGGRAQASKQLDSGGLGGFNVMAFTLGPRVTGPGGVGVGIGTGTHPGSGGDGDGFGGRGIGHRPMVLGPNGGTRITERAVAAALFWLHRHQESGGNWSLSHFRHHCKGHECSGASEIRADAGATALALLTFLAAGQTHQSPGPYRDTIQRAIFWLLKRQTSDGDLGAGAEQPMYSHGLATIALCEAYGMTKDPKIGNPAQAAVAFIERAQNRDTGSWRYEAQRHDGDTSVFGWEVMALKSAQMAGLAVSSFNLENCQHWLQLVAKGEHRGLFCYQYGREPGPAMTAVGLLCRQYLGAKADAPDMIEGKEYLRAHPPENSDNAIRDTYYWYYATQVMFNLGGPEWDQWNRAMRRVLIQTQCQEGCAAGSWDPERPAPDIWGMKGGRMVTTTLSTLTLEVYYRYLPLYRMGHNGASPAAPPAVPPEIAQNPGEAPPPAAATPPPQNHGIGL
jgi:hypothetical protein